MAIGIRGIIGMDFLVQNHEQSLINIPLIKASDYLGEGDELGFCLSVSLSVSV